MLPLWLELLPVTWSTEQSFLVFLHLVCAILPPSRLWLHVHSSHSWSSSSRPHCYLENVCFFLFWLFCEWYKERWKSSLFLSVREWSTDDNPGAFPLSPAHPLLRGCLVSWLCSTVSMSLRRDIQGSWAHYSPSLSREGVILSFLSKSLPKMS